MPNQSNSIAHSNNRENFANQMRLASWIGFGFELTLGIVSFIVLLVAIFAPSFNINLKSGFGLISVGSGLIVLGISIYWIFSYIQIAQKLLSPNPSDHRSAEEVRHTLHTGITIHFIGLLLTILAAQIISANLVLKALTIPSGGAIYQTNQLIEPLDIFVIHASILMITAESLGLFITFWLLKQINLTKKA
jgi:glucan phosphoethanolaminetransferase (alkaline phosphatase superfamily)